MPACVSPFGIYDMTGNIDEWTRTSRDGERPSILKGGYVVYEFAGKEQQKFGDEFPEWRKQMKAGPLARTRRRLVQAADL